MILIIKHLWGGWQYPNITRVKIIFENRIYTEPGWNETEWFEFADIIVYDEVLGRIEVYYTQFKKLVTDSQFLPEEQKLLNTIAWQIGNFIFNKRLKKTIEVLNNKQNKNTPFEINNISLLHPQSDVHWKWRYDFENILIPSNKALANSLKTEIAIK